MRSGALAVLDGAGLRLGAGWRGRGGLTGRFKLDSPKVALDFEKLVGCVYFPQFSAICCTGWNCFPWWKHSSEKSIGNFGRALHTFRNPAPLSKTFFLKWDEMMGTGAMGSARRVRRCMGMSGRRLDDAVACWCGGLLVRRFDDAAARVAI